MEDQLKEKLASLMKDTGKREELAQLFVEYVQPNHITLDVISILLNTRALKPGDAIVKKVRKGLKVRTLVPGSQHLKGEITVSERMNYALDGAQIGVQANEWELQSGELGTIASIRAEMEAKLRDYYLGKVFTALSTVWTSVNTPSNWANPGATITAAALEDAIDQINETTGGVQAVIGSRAAMTPISKFAAFYKDPGGSEYAYTSERLNQLLANGRLGNYYGAPLITVEQTYDNPEDYNKLIPEDIILVVGQKVGEFITYGDVKSQEWTEPRTIPPYWNLDIYQQFGMIIDNAMGIYVIKLS